MNLTASIRAAIAALPAGAEFYATGFTALAVSGGRSPSSVYGTLKNLMLKGEIEKLRGEETGARGMPRPVYRACEGGVKEVVEFKHRDDVGGVWGSLLRKPILRDKPTMTHKADL